METKIIRIEIKFTRKSLALLLGMLAVLAGLAALLWATNTAVASPGDDDGVVPEGGAATAAVVGSRIHYQGRLEGATGPVSVTFRLWADATNTDPTYPNLLWTESKMITPTDGLFNTQLGDTALLPQSRFDGQELWLGVQVEGDSEMTPRQEILPVPYAMSLRPGAQISHTSGSPILDVRNYGEGPGLYGHSRGGYGVFGVSDDADFAAVYGLHGGDGIGVYGYSVAGPAGYFLGDVSQPGWADGLVKAGVFALCTNMGSREIYRSFNNVNSAAITIAAGDNIGHCKIDFGFDVSDRFWVATGVVPAPRMITCVAGDSDSELDCYRFTDAGGQSPGNIMVLVY